MAYAWGLRNWLAFKQSTGRSCLADFCIVCTIARQVVQYKYGKGGMEGNGNYVNNIRKAFLDIH
jgi:hypothetical protein